MTTRAFFDKGIYKSVLKRFSLGSVLYFIMLFLCTGMLLLLAYEPDLFYYEKHSLILEEEFIFPSVMIAFFVPTVVALLCYRFVHSKKTSIFVHSLPVTRTANCISTLAGALTLMVLPVAANGVVLSLISLCGYGRSFGIDDVCIWVLFNVLVLFIMFSISTFSAMCTGNSFALVVINAIFIFAPLLIASITETILLEFLYGYSYKRDLLHFAARVNPVYFLSESADRISKMENLEIESLMAFIAMAIVLYVASYFIYKYRHIETSEEVAGFKVLNPIFKYVVTFVGTITVFSIFTEFLAKKSVLFTFVVILASVIFYFGSEMILKKTLKVWHTYKGYLIFCGAFAGFILFLALTSVFGYETYVPKFEDVEEAAIYNYYYQDEEPFTRSGDLNEYIIEVHNDFVNRNNRSILNHSAYHDTRIHIVYKLKNGKIVTRRYGVGYNVNDAIMETVYKYPEYKEVCEAVFRDDIKNIIEVSVNRQEVAATADESGKLLECLRKDIKSLEYSDIHAYNSEECIASVNVVYFMDDGFVNSFNVNITEKYTNTIEWIKTAGYENLVDFNRLIKHAERADDIRVQESDNTIIYLN